MKKKTVTILSLIILIILFFGAFRIYSYQYNGHGIGRYLLIEKSSGGWREIGDCDGKSIKTYNLEKPYVVSVTGKKVGLDEAIRTHSININDMCKYPNDFKEEIIGQQTGNVYAFENYQIFVLPKECIISALDDVPRID